MMKKTRNEYFDFLRGIAIIFVLGIHAFSSNGSVYTVLRYENIAIRQVFNCAVPLFLAISGYFLGKANLDTKELRISFWKKQIPKVYIPCLVWSFPNLCNSIFMTDSPATIALARFFFCDYGVFYFIIVIIQMYLLLPYIKDFCTKRGVVVVAVLSLLSVVSMNIFYRQIAIPRFGNVLALACPAHWLGFFALGVYLANFSLRQYKLWFPICLLLTGLFLSFYETLMWPKTMGERYGYKITAFIYSYGSILFLFSKKVEALFLRNICIVGRVINRIGVISFGIYLIHFAIVKYLAFECWLFNGFIALLLSILAIAVSKKTFPVFSRKYLGFY